MYLYENKEYNGEKLTFDESWTKNDLRIWTTVFKSGPPAPLPSDDEIQKILASGEQRKRYQFQGKNTIGKITHFHGNQGWKVITGTRDIMG